MVLAFGCTHEKNGALDVNPVINNPGGNNGSDTSVCFQRDVLPIFISHCAIGGCHDAGSAQEDYVLDNYAHIVSRGVRPGNSSGSKLYTICLSGEMPQYPVPKLTAKELGYIKTWIDNGAHNDTNCTTGCDSNIYTYALAIKPLINSYCTGCHSTAGAASSGGGIILDTYTGVSTVANSGRLLGALQHATGYSAMPKGGSKLSDCEITQVSKWVQAGALNN